jgi:hypothetical protein
MENSVGEVGSHDRQETAKIVPASEVRKTLSVILRSTPFRTSKQTQQLLQYIVDGTLAGQPETLKERIIGSCVFNRRPDYDTNADPIVRLRVAEVRKRLALFYQTAVEEPVLIGIPSGSFKAVFEWAGTAPVPSPADFPRASEATHPSVDATIPPVTHERPGKTPSSTRFRYRVWSIVIAASLVVLTLAALRFLPSPEERAFSKFWSPFLENSNSVLIGMGSNPLYELSNAGEDEYYKDHPKSRFEEMGLHPYIPLAPGPIDGKYINPATDRYLTIGDAVALSKIEYVLAQRNIKLDVRFVNDVTYGDIRQSPSILIGAHNNIWTLNMTEDLRFGFQGHNTIVDRFDPHKQWIANSDRSETYAIAARLLNTWNGKVVIVIGGVGYSATRAAGEFITNPESISKMAKSLPKGWETKNVEVVLHTTVKNQIPSAPDVVAIYCW